MRKMSKNPHTGSSFDDFLKEEGVYQECTAAVLKKVLAWQIEQEMRRQNITKSAMADRMQISRTQLDRLLDPEKTGVSLETLQRAATVVGRELRVELV
jgi:antitoxin HicB